MIEPTDEMVQAYSATYAEVMARAMEAGGAIDLDAVRKACLAAVFELVERDLRKQISDVLDDQVRLLRGKPFRSGAVGIEYINGIEDAGSYVETGEWS